MFRTKKAAAILAGALLGPLLPTAAQAAPTPTITLKVLGAFGSGCPKDTTDAQPTADNTAFSLAYSAFRVSGNDYKSCKVSVRVAVPQGWTYAVTSVINRVTRSASALTVWSMSFFWSSLKRSHFASNVAVNPLTLVSGERSSCATVEISSARLSSSRARCRVPRTATTTPITGPRGSSRR